VKILAADAPPSVLTVSAVTGEGLDRLWQAVCDHRAGLEATGALARRRSEQGVIWLRDMVADGLKDYLATRAGDELAAREADVAAGRMAPSAAAAAILSRLP